MRSSPSSPSSTRPTARRRAAATSASSPQGLVKPFADVAFTIDQGVVSKPVKSQFGWHLIEAEGPILPAGTRPLDARSAQIRTQLVEEGRQKSIAQQFGTGGDRAEQGYRVRAGLRPAIAASQ